MPARPNKSSQPEIDRAERHLELLELLAPLAAFLQASGLSDQELREGFNAALRRAKRVTTDIEVVRMGSYHRRGEIIDRWMRNSAFVNKAGKPLDLPLYGKLSITTLVKLAGVEDPPRSILRMLVRFGNVAHLGNGKYRLVKRYMNYRAPGLLPFEPNAQFIMDAISSATRGLGNPGANKELFWLNAEHNVPAPKTKEFLRYVHSRGIVFLHEINDWLDQYAVKLDSSVDRRKLRRVGMALFPFCAPV